MSSSERAPEPTMEDILASIRRIITDDETGQGPAATPDQQAPNENAPVAGGADNQIVDDIARVLDNGAAAVDEEEEILDLTSELGGLEIVEDEAVVEVSEVAEVLELEAPEPGAPVFKPAEPAEASADATLEADAPADTQVAAQDVVAPAVPPQAAEPIAPPPAQEPVAAEPEPKLSASEEAATALERAIAALKAGQVPASDAKAEPFQFQAAPEATDAPETLAPETLAPETPPANAEAQAESGAEANLDLQLEAPGLEPLDPEQGSETELVLTEDQPEEVEKPPFWPVQASEESSSQESSSQESASQEDLLSSEEPSPVTEPQSAPVFASATEEVQDMVDPQTNGAAHLGEVASRSLEDSVKDMLRPMLRQWLDENMPRMVREELDADVLRRERD